jgi:hypothetical protein
MENLQENEYVSYQMNYIKLVEEENIVKGLIEQKEKMILFFNSIPVLKQTFCYEKGKWTIKDILLHLIDAERILAYRALRIARNDSTALSGFDENEYVITANASVSVRGIGYCILGHELHHRNIILERYL